MRIRIYSSSTEGFDTADLKDAKALLDELSNREAASRSARFGDHASRAQ